MTRPDRIADGMYWDRAASWFEGCTPVSAGCRHCWSAAATHMRAAQTSPAIRARYASLTEKGPDGPRFCGRVRTMEADLAKPLHTRKATTWAVWNDFFHPDVPDEFRDQAMAVMALCPQHTFLILTKRAEAMPAYLTDDARRGFGRRSMVGQIHRVARDLCARRQDGTRVTIADTPDMRERDWFVPRTLWGDFPVTWMGISWPLPNVWLGVTAENQETADERIPLLLQTPAAVRYVSLEPLLGAVDLARRTFHPNSLARQSRSSFCDHASCEDWGLCRGQRRNECGNPGRGLDWVIVGGETGPGARPLRPDWARSIRDQCKSAGVPFFFKHWGEWGYLAQGATLKQSTIYGRLVPRMISMGKDTRAYRVGRKAAGRHLDGRTHDAMPETGEGKP